MKKSDRARRLAPLTFAEAADLLADVLGGSCRRDAIAAVTEGADQAQALAGLRRAMATHTLPGADGPVSLRRVVDALDARTRREGLHVLHGWDFVAHRRPDDIAAVMALDYCARIGIPADRTAAVLATLLDHYLLSVLSLLTVRAWDDGDPNANLDRVSALIRQLNGPGGSGGGIVDDAETLILLAVAYYHPEEAAYDQLLDRIRRLDAGHALRFALPCAAVFGSHLRWGLRFMYRNDVGLMRDDNVVDYPWVLFTLSVLVAEYDRLVTAGAEPAARRRVVMAILDGLSPDPWAFVAAPPACLAAHGAEHARLRAGLARHRAALLDDFRALQPRPDSYSPLGFECNFLSNAVVALLATAAHESSHGTLNRLFDAGEASDGDEPAAVHLIDRLVGYATGDPSRLAKGGAPLIVYDPRDAAHYFNAVVRTLAG